ncbi:MAG: glycoside hydrolase family 28 protein [Candidatus Parvarchaeota archaeon]|nr:glycoside hydrolase family 28 protein [Candidatus Jingweiarchaeum tengchongense]
MIKTFLSNIKPPLFSNKDFSIIQFGGVGDGITDCTQAFSKSIKACHESGGGRVVVPSGKFLTGPIHLLSNVNLHLEKGAEIIFKTDPSAYLPLVLVSWEGIEAMNYSPLIYAYDQENIAITGEGTLDGQANNEQWWPWKGKKEFGWKEGQPNQEIGRIKLKAMAFDGLPVEKRLIGDGGYLRPDFIQLFKCKNILIDGISIIRSPNWEINLVLSENITVRGINIDTHGPNNDGIDVCSSKNVLIENSTFDTGDDCIVLKSGRNDDGRRVNTPTENVIVRNVNMKDGHGGITIGSEISAGVKNVYVENCTINSPNLWVAIRIKSNTMRGGTVENVNIKHVMIEKVRDAVFSVDFYYEDAKGPYIPIVRDIHLEDIKSKSSKYAIHINTDSISKIKNLDIVDCEFQNVSDGNFINGYFENLTLENVILNGQQLNVQSLEDK